jgi:hypothetical protein
MTYLVLQVRAEEKSHLFFGLLFMYSLIMKQSITEIQKRGRGRPATGRDPAVTSRLPEATIAAIDNWAEKNDVANRAEAIRRLVEIGLKAKAK